MERAEIFEKIQAVVRQELSDDELSITEQTTAADVPGWDSLTHVQIIVAVEKLFGRRFRASDVAQLQNIGSLIDLVIQA